MKCPDRFAGWDRRAAEQTVVAQRDAFARSVSDYAQEFHAWMRTTPPRERRRQREAIMREEAI